MVVVAGLDSIRTFYSIYYGTAACCTLDLAPFVVGRRGGVADLIVGEQSYPVVGVLLFGCGKARDGNAALSVALYIVGIGDVHIGVVALVALGGVATPYGGVLVGGFESGGTLRHAVALCLVLFRENVVLRRSDNLPHGVARYRLLHHVALIACGEA